MSLTTDETEILDVRYWGIKLRHPWTHLRRKVWDFEYAHAMIMHGTRILGPDLMSTLAALGPAIAMADGGDKLAMAQVVLMDRANSLRDALTRALTDDRPFLYMVLSSLSAEQGGAAEPLPFPILDSGNGNKVNMQIFGSPAAVYMSAFACLVESLAPLDVGGLTQRASLKSSSKHKNALAAHLKTYWQTQSVTAPLPSKSP